MASGNRLKTNTDGFTVQSGIIVDRKRRKCPIRSWIPAKPQLQVYVVHGFSEHLECYEYFAEELCKKGIAVHTIDLIGHGHAEGIRGHIYHFLEFVELIALFHQKNPFSIASIPEFMFGHSMGGLIAGLYVAEKGENGLQGLILNNPLLGFDPISHGHLKFIAKFLSRKDPTVLFPKPSSFAELTRKTSSMEYMRRDPVRLRVVTPKLLLQMEEWSQILQIEAGQIKLPLMMFLSHHDKVVYPHKSMIFYRSCSSKDKKALFFAEAKHETVQDLEVDKLLEILNSWLQKRM